MMRTPLYPVVGITALVACFDSGTVVPSVPTASIEGVVTDGTVDEPLHFAAVKLVGAEIHDTLTDLTGRFSFRGLPVGEYTVKVVIIGYAPQERLVTVTAEQTAVADFALAITSINLDEIIVTGFPDRPFLCFGNRSPEEMRPVPGL